MRLEVVIPEPTLGAVLGDLQARRALIQGTAPSGDDVAIRAEAPLEPLLGYATALRSLTQGRGQFSMELDRFDVTAID
jgi:elongation factor G